MSTPALPVARNKEQLLSWAKRQKFRTLSAPQLDALDAVYPEWRQTLDGTWFTNLERVEAFLAANGSYPRASAEDPAEKAIGIWIATQRYRVDLLPESRIKMLDDRLPGWNKSKEEKWQERLEEVCAIVADLGRLPNSSEKDPEAKRASTWLRNHRDHPDSDWRVVALNKRLPGWGDPAPDFWAVKLTATIGFVDRHNRMPTQHEKNKADKALGTWLNAQRCARDLSDSRRAQLDERLPGWARTAEDKWNAALDYVVTFLETYGKLPSSKSADAAEGFHGRWLSTQSRNPDAILPHRRALLDERLPAWRHKRDERWTAMLERVESFISRHRRVPSAKAADRDEASLGAWLANQRHGVGLAPAREAMLRSRIPEVFARREDVWMEKLLATAAFYADHGRLPRNGAKDASEKRLGVWLQNTKRKQQSDERIAVLDAKVPTWRVTADDVWNERLEFVAEFLSANGRFPSTTAEDKAERKHGVWLNNHRVRPPTDPVRLARMTDRLPGWNRTMEDLWRDRLSEVITFRDLTGRLPGFRKDGLPDELRHAQWLSGQRRHKKLEQSRQSTLDAVLPGWR